MFTIKFYKAFDNCSLGNVASSVSCPRYDVYDRGNGSYEVTVFRQYAQHDDAVSFQVCNGRPDGYQQCYVTNEAGKTIDAIRASDDACKVTDGTE